ncbi:hypothetical protein D3C76_1581640 [compost metagenome]
MFCDINPNGDSSSKKIPLNSPGDPFSLFLTFIIEDFTKSPFFTVINELVSPSIIACPNAP